MATVVPPPNKRQKSEALEKQHAKQSKQLFPQGQGSVRVRFVEKDTGKSAGQPIIVPVADITNKNLELLLNTLQGHTSEEKIPYVFFLPDRISAASKDDGRGSDETGDAGPSEGEFDTEGEIIAAFRPAAVFKVRAVSRCASSIPGHAEAILALAFSPATSSVLATGSGDKTARLMDCDTGTPIHTLKGHTGWILVVSWSPDASLLATGSYDNTVRLWDPRTGEARGQPLKGHAKWIMAIAWEPYHVQKLGRPRLASASKDATIRIWDAVSTRIETTLSGHQGSVTCVRWGGLGRLYSSSHDKTIKVWDPDTGKMIATLSAHAHWVNHLALSTELVLKTGFYDHTGERPKSEADQKAKARQRFETAAAVYGNITERLVSASDDFTMYLWAPGESSKPLARLHGHQKQVNHVTFSPDGALIASASFDNHVKLWNAADGQYISTLRGHVGPVYMTCFSSDSRLLVSGSKDTTLKIWDVQTGKLRENLPGHKDEVFAVDWSVDGGKVGSGGKDKAVNIWRH